MLWHYRWQPFWDFCGCIMFHVMTLQAAAFLRFLWLYTVSCYDITGGSLFEIFVAVYCFMLWHYRRQPFWDFCGCILFHVMTLKAAAFVKFLWLYNVSCYDITGGNLFEISVAVYCFMLWHYRRQPFWDFCGCILFHVMTLQAAAFLHFLWLYNVSLIN